MDLRGLRELLGKTQEEVAALLERSQGQVSETERRQDVLLSTLRSYVKALGGELEIIARFGDKQIRIHGALKNSQRITKSWRRRQRRRAGPGPNVVDSAPLGQSVTQR
jgi:transcriptional regulator with XRE-family HTH domain